MRNFILPGGHPLVSYTHLARCVCRRAERRIVDLMSVEAVPEHLIQYVNRLSDYFFVVSRAFSFEENAKETALLSQENTHHCHPLGWTRWRK